MTQIHGEGVVTARQAYEAMFGFVQRWYSWTQNNDEVGDVASSMSTLDNGIPADPAIWEEWFGS